MLSVVLQPDRQRIFLETGKRQMQKLITRAVPTGVNIVTVRSGDRINGMTVAWATQVSFKPRLIAVSIAPPRFTYGLIKESGFFCINALPEGAGRLARHFGFKSGRKVDKFKDIEYENALNGSPVIKEAYAYLECQVKDVFPSGDHEIFVGEVVDSGELSADVKPLIFRWEDFFGKK